MKSFFGKYRALKIGAIILLVLVLAVFGTGKYLSIHYRNLLLDKLPGIASRATNGLYKLSAGEIGVNVLTGSISVFDLRLTPDTAVVRKRRIEKTLPPVLLDIAIREIEIAGLKKDKGGAISELRCRIADIYHPKIIVTVTDTASRGKVPHEESLSKLKLVMAKELNILDPEIVFNNSESDTTGFLSVKGGSIKLQKWRFEPGGNALPSNFFLAQDGYIELCNLKWRKPGQAYLYDVDTVFFASALHTAMIKGLSVSSILSEDEFFQEDATQKEIYKGFFPEISLTGFNWEALLAGKGFAAATATFDRPELKIYHNQYAPRSAESKMGNYPNELIRKLKFPLAVPAVYFYDGAFYYTELAKATKKQGKLDFTNVYGSITGITTAESAVEMEEVCTIKFAAKFMRKSNLGVVFDFPLAAKDGDFKVTGQLQQLEGTQLNDAAVALALAQIKSLKMHRMDFVIEGDDSASQGEITILYNDLKVGIMKMDTVRQQMRKRGLVSMVANGLVLYNDNPMEGEKVRVAHTSVVRDPARSFINQLWKNLFQAGVQTAVRQEGITDLVKKSKAQKGKAKVHFFRKLFPKRNKKARK